MMYSMAQKLKRSRFKLKKNEGEPIPDIYDRNTENGSLDFFFNLQLRFLDMTRQGPTSQKKSSAVYNLEFSPAFCPHQMLRWPS